MSKKENPILEFIPPTIEEWREAVKNADKDGFVMMYSKIKVREIKFKKIKKFKIGG